MSSVQTGAVAGGATAAQATAAGVSASYFGCAALAAVGFAIALLFVFKNSRNTVAPAKVIKVK